MYGLSFDNRISGSQKVSEATSERSHEGKRAERHSYSAAQYSAQIDNGNNTKIWHGFLEYSH